MRYLKILFTILAFSSYGQQVTKVFDINSPETVIEYIDEHYATYCKKGPSYNNAVVPFNESGAYSEYKYIIIGKEDIRDGQLITLKMSENTIFTFLIFNVYDKNAYTGKTMSFYAPIKFGEIDKQSYKKLNLTKKRLYINNTFTEELCVGNLKFTIENKTNFSKLSIGSKTINLNSYDIYSDASFKCQEINRK